MSVYLDYNATTPLDERVLSAMLPYLSARYGNASSRHEQGRVARRAVELAREQVAAAAGAHPTEVVFTSGGSEANNLFLQGAAAALGRSGMVAFSAIEHPCVLNAARQLTRRGWRLAELPVDAEGRVTLAGVEAVLSAAEKPELWSLMLANTSYFAFAGIEGDTLLARLDRAGFAVASGSACSSANPDPSHVLLAMGVPPTLARGALRVSLGAQTTTTEIDDFLGALKTALSELQKLTALQS
ncbi:hypothetical protein AGMMS50289_24110 [Betaproteobacteria bacterium]|nr:hypothetical protein AGMMS50289_24110 [Betaproteobacteria bacterium]